jgi:hypothetical protein
MERGPGPRLWGEAQGVRAHHYLLLGVAAAAVAGLLTACGGSGDGPAAAGPSSASAVPAARPTTTATTTAAHTGPAGTTHHTFAPYDESGRLVATVVGGHRPGKCWTTSIAVPIAGVYRCFSGNEILDPCFAPALETSPPTVACFADPWHPGTVLALRGALPKDEPLPTDGHPWAVELANHARCVGITGVVPTVGDVPVQYRCADGLVAGLVQAGSGTVTAQYGTMRGPLHSAQIVAEWRGRSYHIDPDD